MLIEVNLTVSHPRDALHARPDVPGADDKPLWRRCWATAQASDNFFGLDLLLCIGCLIAAFGSKRKTGRRQLALVCWRV